MKIIKIIKKFLILVDYIFWLIFDFSKLKKIQKNKIKKVLIIHNGAIGEILASTPIAKTIKNQLGATIHYLAKEGPSQVLEKNPNIDKIVFYEEDHKKNYLNIKNESYDLAIILWPASLKVTWACLKARIPYRVGCFKMVREGPAFFLTRRIFPLRFEGRHAIESNSMMLNLIGLKNEDPKLDLFLSENEIKKIDLFLKKNKSGNFAIVHPGFGKLKEGKHLSRKWPEKRFAQVCDYLIEKKKLKVFLTGTEEEKKVAEKIRNMANNKDSVKVLCGKLNLRELLALLMRSNILIAPDSGVIHLAAALKVKTIDLMSRSHPNEWGPWQQKNNYRVLFHPKNSKGETCSDEDQSCILNISVEEVGKAIEELISGDTSNK